MDPNDEFLGNEESDDMEDDAEKIELYEDCESIEVFCRDEVGQGVLSAAVC